jgi:hypothetical protein
MKDIEFNEKAYREYLAKREFPSNSRVRPEGVSFMDIVVEGEKIMESTEEGREILEYINQLGE